MFLAKEFPWGRVEELIVGDSERAFEGLKIAPGVFTGSCLSVVVEAGKCEDVTMDELNSAVEACESEIDCTCTSDGLLYMLN